VWVLVIATLLGGVVALNVGALRNSIEASRLSGQVAQLRAQNQALQSSIAEDSGIGRISAKARALGMIQVQPTKHDFLRLHPGTGHPAATGPRPRRASHMPATRHTRKAP
jgi:hypothetical protein